MFSALNRDRKQGLVEIFPDGGHERVTRLASRN
jgi:hypothetical protein